MLLSKLVYETVKNVVYYDDSSFTYEEFKNGTFDKNPDYVNFINNVLTPLNEAIARLNDLERIQYKILDLNVSNKTVTIPEDCKEVIGVGIIGRTGVRTLHWRPLGVDKLFVDTVAEKVSVEYKQDICFTGYLNEDDVNLRIYGITDQMAQYIIEYVEGKLSEPISADIANMHIIRSENYFSGLRIARPALVQDTVAKAYDMGY